MTLTDRVTAAASVLVSGTPERPTEPLEADLDVVHDILSNQRRRLAIATLAGLDEGETLAQRDLAAKIAAVENACAVDELTSTEKKARLRRYVPVPPADARPRRRYRVARPPRDSTRPEPAGLPRGDGRRPGTRRGGRSGMTDAARDNPARDISDGPPTLLASERDDGKVKIEEPFATPGEWIAFEQRYVIAEEKCR